MSLFMFIILKTMESSILTLLSVCYLSLQWQDTILYGKFTAEAKSPVDSRYDIRLDVRDPKPIF